MRHARILDVLRAVTEASASRPEVETWWYAPARRLRLMGELPRNGQETASLEVVVEIDPAISADCDGIAAELSRRLPGSPVSVRLHRGAAEERQLFRLVSSRSRTGRNAAARGPADSGATRMV